MKNKIEYLKQLYSLELKIRRVMDQIAILEELASSPASIQYNLIAKNESLNTTAPFVEIIDKIELNYEKMSKLSYLHHNLKKQLSMIISNLENTIEQKVLILRYLDYLTWDDIGKKTNYSVSAIRKIHNKAIDNLILPDEKIII